MLFTARAMGSGATMLPTRKPVITKFLLKLLMATVRSFHARQRQNRQKWLAVTKAGVNIIRHHQQVVLPGKARHRLQRRSGITHPWDCWVY